MKKSYETPSIWIEKRFTIKGEYMLILSGAKGQMHLDDETIEISDGTDTYATDHVIEGFSGPSAKDRKDEEWGRLW